MFLDELPASFVITTAVLLGMNFGSFLNVVIYRLPRGMSLVRPGSSCPACKNPIRAYDNIPVLGWALLGGKARCCKTPISARYPAVEALGGLLTWSIVLLRLFPRAHELPLGEAGLLFAVYTVIALGLLAAALIDLEHMILPDSITLGGVALGILSSPLRPEVDVPGALLGAVIGYVAIWLPFIWLHTRLRGFPGMGMGDAKLMALAGAWFGPLGVLITLFAGALQGTLVAGIALAFRGEIEEPEAVKQQRAELLDAIANAEGELKSELQKEFDDDPLAEPPTKGAWGARVAFGPFLSLALLEQLLFFDTIYLWLDVYFLL